MFFLPGYHSRNKNKLIIDVGDEDINFLHHHTIHSCAFLYFKMSALSYVISLIFSIPVKYYFFDDICSFHEISGPMSDIKDKGMRFSISVLHAHLFLLWKLLCWCKNKSPEQLFLFNSVD